MITKKICKQFNNYTWKVEEHPAAPSMIYSFNQLLWYSLQEVCKHGYTSWVKKDGVLVPYNKKNYEKYKKFFDKELKDNEEEKFSALIYAHIPYKIFYGEEWKFDHVEYWGEMNFVVFHGNDFSKYFNHKEWQCYDGPHCSARSFEELIIKISKMFLKMFGSKTDEDFLTKKEKDNHKKHQRFKTDRLTENGKGHYLDKNPKYITVNAAEINRRWLKWFVTTDYCKKWWKDSFDELLNTTIKKNGKRK